MTKLELQQLLQSMDHYTQYSDDFSVYSKGRKQQEFVLKQLDKLFDKKSESLEFYNENTPDGVGYIQSYIDELKAQGN
jgi:hypothetical protein|tara:strand:+ start:340 stop:573 length:234 start_codon:yes stop_codon:yes gene_type:complete